MTAEQRPVRGHDFTNWYIDGRFDTTCLCGWESTGHETFREAITAEDMHLVSVRPAPAMNETCSSINGDTGVGCDLPSAHEGDHRAVIVWIEAESTSSSSRRRADAVEYPSANDPAVAEMVDDPQAYFKKVREGKR